MRQIVRSLLAALVASVTSVSISATARADADMNVMIINGTHHTMVRFYATGLASEWPEDLLGDDTLKPGASLVVNLGRPGPPCIYDFAGIFEDGDKVVRYRINVCKISSFRFTED